MGNLVSNLLEKLASGFSGAESSTCLLWHYDPVECPKELIK